jgi:anti-sigma B factor antagonist
MGMGGTNLDSIVDAEIITIAEDLNGKTVDEFKGQVTTAIEKGHRHIILDCKVLKNLNSEGLESLLWFLEEVQKADGLCKVASLGQTPAKIFEITQFDKIFELYDDVISAVKSI